MDRACGKLHAPKNKKKVVTKPLPHVFGRYAENLPQIIKEMEQKALAVMRGEKASSRSWELSQKADGSWERVAIDPKAAQLDRARAWKAKSSVAKIRAKLNLTQTAFAKLLGIPVQTLQKWEGEETKPSGPAQTLLKIADKRPDELLELLEA